MRDETRESITAAINQYDLHETAHVTLWPLEDLFLIRYLDMSGMGSLGTILTPPNGWPVTAQNRARVLIDQDMGPDDARVIIAHEMGHGFCEHVGSASSYALGLHDRHEREAWEAAALLLIPERVIYEEQDVARIAAACGVPHWLVGLWPSTSG